MKNEIRIDLKGNPGVADYFSGRKPGEPCEFEIRGKVKDITDAEAVIAIDKFVVEQDGEENAISPEEEKPMMMSMAPPPSPPTDETGTDQS